MDGETALKKAQALASRSLGSSDRRRYIQHLLTLPSYHQTDLNEYYARSITRDFGEFEEYQDQAVDAILDLCEDENEQTRISGVQALAEIGKVEPKWVRGNTGVLVQLLECPPSELRHVKKALFDLLNVSPSDVFSMMAEDCKTEEGSRLNILNFLIYDAAAQRKEILESGKYVEAEHIFSNGFYDVLPTTAGQTVQILELLMTLSTITGREATRETKGKYAKALISYIPSSSSTTTTMTAIKMWDEFIKRANPDPRWTIYFLATHGSGVVKAAMGDEKVAKGILGFYDTQSQSRWRRILEERDDKDLEIRSLLPKFATTMVEAAVSHQNTTNLPVLELTWHSIYTILTLSRETRDVIPRSLIPRLIDFGDFANRKKKDSRSKKEEEGWRGIRDMADILGDHKMIVEDIRLTWSGRERSRSPVKAATYSKPVANSVDRQPESGRGSSIPIVGTSQQTRTVPAPAPLSGPSRSAAVPTPSAPRHVPTPRPATPPPPPVIIARSEAPVQAQGLSIKSKAAASVIQPTASSVNNPEVNAPAQASTPTLNIRSRAANPSISTKQEDTKVPIPSIPTNQGLSIRSASTPISTPKPGPSRPASLLSRLAPSTSNSGSNIPTTTTPTNKRSRAEDFTPNTPDSSLEVPARSSLADRLGGSEKKQRVASSPESSGAGTPSLLSRMSQSQTSIGQETISNPKPQPTSTAGGFTMNRTGTPSAPSVPSPVGSGFSFKRPASATVSPAQSPGVGGFSIKNRSISTTSTPSTQSNNQSSGLRIKRESTEIHSNPPIQSQNQTQVDAEEKMDEDTPVIRKGRGFAAKQETHGELLITPPNPPVGGVSGSAGGRLQDRIKFGPGR